MWKMKVVTIKSIVNVIRARRGYKDFLYKFINECEIVDAIKNGTTNGEVIKNMFTNLKVEDNGVSIYLHYPNGGWIVF